MNKKLLLFIPMFLLTFYLSYSLSIKGPESPQDIHGGKLNKVTLNITNDNGIADTFYVSVWPSQWVTLDRNWFDLVPRQEVLLGLSIIPPRNVEEGLQVFTINVNGIRTNASSSTNILLSMKRQEDVFIDLKLNKQVFRGGDVLEITPTLTNYDRKQAREVSVMTTIERDNFVVKKFEDVVLVNPRDKQSPTYAFPIRSDFLYGDYKVKAEIKDNLGRAVDSVEKTFKVEMVEGIVVDKTVGRGFIYTNVEITATNTGNSPKRDVVVTDSVPKLNSYFFYPKTEPISADIADNRVVYTWKMDLGIGESKTIEYQIRYTPAVFSALFLALFAYVVSDLFFKPIIGKRYSGVLTKDKEVTISLHIKNNKRSVLRDVKVVDFVPAVAMVVKEFGTLVPTIKKTEMGTKFIWVIDKIKPGEERILTYKIKPVIEVIGSLDLPKAHFTYEYLRGRKTRIASKTLTVKAKV